MKKKIALRYRGYDVEIVFARPSRCQGPLSHPEEEFFSHLFLQMLKPETTQESSKTVTAPES